MTLEYEQTWTETSSLPYKTYTLANFKDIPQISQMPEEKQFEIEVVGNVLPFKSNNYVVEQLINWKDVPNDPMYVLNFPQKGMLLPEHYKEMASVLKEKAERKEILSVANKIRMKLNPHPAGQMQYNVPKLKDGTVLCGMQHKYKETCLFFPTQGQTCHAYCTFCFRWPQFIGKKELKFAMHEQELLVQYLKEHPEVTDVLFTGGDVMVMKATILENYLNALLDADLPNLRTIRIGTKSLSYWPYRYISDDDSDHILELFERVSKHGLHLTIVAHFNHYRELSTAALKNAVNRIKKTGAQIRTQSPLLRYINDAPNIWSEMWNQQVSLGMIPYYMFIARDTGAQHFFAVPLVKAQQIFRDAYAQVSGLGRTVRGPSMSTTPGKIEIIGVEKINDEKVMVLRFLQGRDHKWVGKPFFAKYDEKAIWFDQLKPAFGYKFFFEDEFNHMLSKDLEMVREVNTACISPS
jgi:KamA family protein